MPENEKRQSVIQVVFPRELSEMQIASAIGAAIMAVTTKKEREEKPSAGCLASSRNFNPEYSFPTIYFP